MRSLRLLLTIFCAWLFGAIGCAERGDLEAVQSTAARVDFDAGDVAGTVSWNGSVVGGLEAQGLFAYIPDAVATWLNYDYLDPASGSYALSNVVPGDHSVQLEQSDCAQPEGLLAQTPVSVQAGVVTTADIDMSASAGKVIGSITVNGLPTAWPEVRIPSLCGSWGSDQDGLFARFLPPGTYTASVRVSGGLLGSFTFDVTAGAVTDVGSIDFGQGEVTGTVSWSGAAIGAMEAWGLFANVPDADANWLSYDYVDSNGSYMLSNVVPGDHSVQLEQSDCAQPEGLLAQTPVSVQAGVTTTLDLDLSASAGKVVGSITVNGLPAAWPDIRVASLCGSWGTDSEGLFAHFLPPGTYTASVRVSGGLLGSFTFDVAAGAVTDVGSLDFAKGDVTGTVSWNGSVIGGLEARGLFAYVPDADENWLNYTYPDPASGSYTLPNVVPGDHSVHLEQSDCAQPEGLLAQAPVSVQAGVVTTADIDMTASAGRVIGSITVNGLPAAWPEVRIPSLCGSWGSDQDGLFAHYLPPGTYTASVRVSGGLVGSFTFTVLAGQTTDVDLGTTPAGTDVTVDLSGGVDEVGGISLTFSEVLAGGSTTVVESGAGPPPDTGFRIVGLAGQPRYWDIDTTAEFSPPILVCIHYDPAEVNGNESNLQLRHDDGSGWEDITDSIDEDQNVICGFANSLSPFAVFEAIDTDDDGDSDGVADAADACPQTKSGAAVNARGCSIDDLCPCNARWRNRGQYVACGTRVGRAFVQAGLISRREWHQWKIAALRSHCGRRPRHEGQRRH